MPIPYSYDLRKKVIDAIDEGMSKTEASRIFHISRNTINLWLIKREKTGDYKAEVGYQKGYNPKITDLEEFEQFAQANGSLTQKEMAEKWTGKISGQPSAGAKRPHYRKSTKKTELHSKKKLTDTKKEMKRKDVSLS